MVTVHLSNLETEFFSDFEQIMLSTELIYGS